MKIIEQLTDDTFVIKVEKREHGTPKEVSICHDFVEFEGSTLLYSENNLSLKTSLSGTANCLSIPSSVQIPIRSMIKIVLPMLNDHKYLQEEHIADREYTEDNLPRYKKGDKYAAYSYYNQAVQFWDANTKEMMVAFIGKDERTPNIVTLKFYNEFVKPNLNRR